MVDQSATPAMQGHDRRKSGGWGRNPTPGPSPHAGRGKTRDSERFQRAGWDEPPCPLRLARAYFLLIRISPSATVNSPPSRVQDMWSNSSRLLSHTPERGETKLNPITTLGL